VRASPVQGIYIQPRAVKSINRFGKICKFSRAVQGRFAILAVQAGKPVF